MEEQRWQKTVDSSGGARQVGKTYIVNYFAGKEYFNSVYCNFEKDDGLRDFFMIWHQKNYKKVVAV